MRMWSGLFNFPGAVSFNDFIHQAHTGGQTRHWQTPAEWPACVYVHPQCHKQRLTFSSTTALIDGAAASQGLSINDNLIPPLFLFQMCLQASLQCRQIGWWQPKITPNYLIHINLVIIHQTLENCSSYSVLPLYGVHLQTAVNMLPSGWSGQLVNQ